MSCWLATIVRRRIESNELRGTVRAWRAKRETFPDEGFTQGEIWGSIWELA